MGLLNRLVLVVSFVAFLYQTGLCYDLLPFGSLKLTNSSSDETTYYISSDHLGVAWGEAQTACQTLLNGTLLSIESEYERNGINTLLEAYFNGTSDSFTQYWTSGVYNSGKQAYEWSSNGVPFPPWAPWASGEPFPISPTRQVIIDYDRGNSTWKIGLASEKFICEVGPPSVVVPCYSTNDLIIILDSSGSVGRPNYELAKQFVAELSAGFFVHPENRLGFAIYSSQVLQQFTLNNVLTNEEMLQVILGSAYQGGGTATDKAIDYAVGQFTMLNRTVQQNMVILTDGMSDNPQLTIGAANRAKAAGIRGFSVGITTSVNMQELLAIAGGDNSRVFTADNFDLLIKLLTPLSSEICEG